MSFLSMQQLCTFYASSKTSEPLRGATMSPIPFRTPLINLMVEKDRLQAAFNELAVVLNKRKDCLPLRAP